jgi:hypothetical protein
MRTRVVVAAAGALAVALLTACTAAPVQRTLNHPFLVPQDLAWQYATSCFGEELIGGGVISLSYGEGASRVEFAEDTPESQAEKARIEACLDEYRFADASNDLDYVDGYERSQLWDYYTAITVPCLAALGVELAPIPREDFFTPDQRPWNPYPSMQDVPFAELIDLYEACPPVPDYLQVANRS